jgi:hypothetical protein
VFLVETAASLHLHLIPLRPAIFYAANISATGAEVVTQVMWRLVHLLLIIVVTALASLRAWRASVIVGVSFIVDPGSSIEMGAATLVLRAFVVLMLASTIDGCALKQTNEMEADSGSH